MKDLKEAHFTGYALMADSRPDHNTRVAAFGAMAAKEPVLLFSIPAPGTENGIAIQGLTPSQAEKRYADITDRMVANPADARLGKQADMLKDAIDHAAAGNLRAHSGTKDDFGTRYRQLIEAAAAHQASLPRISLGVRSV